MRRVGFGLVAVLVIATGAWLAVERGEGHGPATSPDAATAAGVCDAVATARRGGDARAVFLERAHDGLHDLAARTAEADRATAATLLRAKNLVEDQLDEDPSATDLTTALLRLHESTLAAAVVLGSPEGRPCAE